MVDRARLALTTVMGVALVAVAAAQKSAGTKSVMHDITVKTESVYTGTMDVAVDRGKVTGRLHLVAPTEIVGKLAGTSKGGVMTLDFPYEMTQRKCTGTVKMIIKVPPRPGPAAGTMEAVGCGRDETRKLTGTVELVPTAKKPSTKG